MKFRIFFALFALFFSLPPVFAQNLDADSLEEVTFTKTCEFSVMFRTDSAPVTFSLAPSGTGANSLLVTVYAFSYKDKSLGDFSFTAAKSADGNFVAKKQVVQSTSDGKPISVTVSSAKIDSRSQSVEIKYKPGKMPFAIKMRTAGK